MIRYRTPVSIMFTLVLIMSTVAGALAAPFAEELPACSGTITGTVVAVDPETGTITIDIDGSMATTTDRCTVTVGGDFEHPIVNLLGTRFTNVSPEDFDQAVIDQLQNLNACVLPVVDPVTGATTYTHVACDTLDTNQQAVVITWYDPVTGLYTATLPDGSTITFLITDPVAATLVQDALAALALLTVTDWSVLDGHLLDGAYQVQYYHDMGIGFGVLIKLYSMAELNGIPVDQLVQEFLAGNGMGLLMKSYGRPQYMGIGHLRKEVKNAENGDDPSDDGNSEKNKPNKPDKQPKENKQNNADKDKDKDKTKNVCSNPNANPKAKTKCP